jgi:hypothetical protein
MQHSTGTRQHSTPAGSPYAPVPHPRRATPDLQCSMGACPGRCSPRDSDAHGRDVRRFVQGGGNEYVCTTLVPVPNCNPGDTLLSLPQIRCYIMPGENGSPYTSWVIVSEFSVEGVFRSLPVSPSSHATN